MFSSSLYYKKELISDVNIVIEYRKHTNDLEAGCDNSHLFNKVHYSTNSSKPISSEYWI